MANAKKLIVELKQQTAALTKKDIRDWRNAWQMAVNTERPYRNALYDIYTDVLADAHVSGAIEQRKKMVLQKEFKIVNAKSGEEEKDAYPIFDTSWFYHLLELVLDARFWGHSLVQLGDPVQHTNGSYRFADVQLVPRKHVIPEFGLITREPGDEPNKGFSYRKPPFNNWLIEAGNPSELGLLLKCTPHAISKKNMAAFWDQFGEIFGMPIRIANTTTTDPKEIANIDNMMESMGAKAWARFNELTEITFQETKHTDAFNVYDKRIERSNSELSKLILGQTMTMDNGSSQSQSETHLKVLNNIVDSDADMLRNVINDQLLPLCAMHGIAPDGLRFDWDKPLGYTASEQIQLEQMLLNRYAIDPKYFSEKYNIPITGETEAQPGKTELRLSQTDFFD